MVIKWDTEARLMIFVEAGSVSVDAGRILARWPNANKPTAKAIQHQVTNLRQRLRGVNISIHASSARRAATLSAAEPLTPVTSSPIIAHSTTTNDNCEADKIAKPTPASATSVFAKPPTTTDTAKITTASGTKVKSEPTSTTKPSNAFTSRLVNSTNDADSTEGIKTPRIRKRKAHDLSEDEGSMSDGTSSDDARGDDDEGAEFRKTPSRTSLPRRSKSATPAKMYELEKTDAAALEEGSEASDGAFEPGQDDIGSSGRAGKRRLSASARKGMAGGACRDGKRMKLDDVSEGDE